MISNRASKWQLHSVVQSDRLALKLRNSLIGLIPEVSQQSEAMCSSKQAVSKHSGQCLVLQHPEPLQLHWGRVRSRACLLRAADQQGLCGFAVHLHDRYTVPIDSSERSVSNRWQAVQQHQGTPRVGAFSSVQCPGDPGEEEPATSGLSVLGFSVDSDWRS